MTNKKLVIDATEKGVGIWACMHCRRLYVIEHDQRRVHCLGGCPGHIQRVDEFQRPAESVRRRIRGVV